MTINLAAIQATTRPGLNAIFGSYEGYEKEWAQIYDVYQSNKQQEIDVEMKYLGRGALKPEGSAIQMDDMQQFSQITYVHKAIALGFQITEEAIEDNLYQDQFPMAAVSLRHGMDQTKEIMGAAVFNNGTSGSFLGADGVPLFSIAHPIVGGTVANRPTVAADLSEASLEAALIAIASFKDVATLTIKTMAKKLLVPKEGQYTASRLLNSQFRPGVNNNDINAINHGNYLPEGFIVNHFLNQPNNWFVLTDAKNAFKHFVRTKLRTDVQPDFSTSTLMCKAWERYAFGYSNWRGAYAGVGT